MIVKASTERQALACLELTLSLGAVGDWCSHSRTQCEKRLDKGMRDAGTWYGSLSSRLGSLEARKQASMGQVTFEPILESFVEIHQAEKWGKGILGQCAAWAKVCEREGLWVRPRRAQLWGVQAGHSGVCGCHTGVWGV